VTGIDALQAAAFCAWIGRRLPTVAEWQTAATDGAGTTWPWRDDQQIFDFANLHQSGPLDLDRPPDPVGSRRPTGSGFYDLVGNVVEWTATAWSAGGQAAGETWNGQAATVPRDLTTVGGSYLATPRSFAPINAAAAVRAADLGFRCAEDRLR
jgi:formylglycine-generating enzyme required for sulfatase activity